MEHRDHMGNVGQLMAGDVQWMKAGSGVIHSEMPKQVEGRMRGFQLWVNLPAKHKMVAPKYQDIPAAQIPTVQEAGVAIRVIRGTYEETTGPAESLMPVRILDVTVEAHATWSITPNEGNTFFLCIHEGAIQTTDQNGGIQVIAAPAVVTFDGLGDVHLSATDVGANILYCEGTPLNEPIASHGPFVMNTHSEIRQAVDDYNSGKLAT